MEELILVPIMWEISSLFSLGGLLSAAPCSGEAGGRLEEFAINDAVLWLWLR